MLAKISSTKFNNKTVIKNKHDVKVNCTGESQINEQQYGADI